LILNANKLSDLLVFVQGALRKLKARIAGLLALCNPIERVEKT
jgi:hypothetical protein